MCQDIKAKDFVVISPTFHIKMPMYLTNWQDAASLLLTVLLILMLSFEPIVHCFDSQEFKEKMFTVTCQEADFARFTYSVFAMVATLLYFALTIDLSVFSTRVSAFVLVCFRVLSEVWLFLFALGFFIATFSAAVSALEQENEQFAGIPLAALALLKVSFAMFSGEHYDALHNDPALMTAVVCYIIVTVVFLSNLLIAQLNCSYQSTYQA